MTLIFWCRRDPRLDDNTALGEAYRQSRGAVIPVFILDDAILTAPTTAPARVYFLMESLREMDVQLRERGAQLIVRRGKPVAELLKLLDETDADGVFFNRDYEPYALQRDGEVLEAFTKRGKRAEAFADHLLAEPDDIRTNQNKPSTIYTPFRRRWLARLDADPSLTAQRSDAKKLQFKPIPADLASLPVPTATELGFAIRQNVITPGAAAAQKVLGDWVQRGTNGLREYHHQRNKLGVEGTSHISAHLRLGSLAARTAARAALTVRDQTDDPDEKKACETWLGEIAWRDFYTGIMYHFPYVLERPYKDLFVNFPFRDAPPELRAWQEGRTGYPVVDAGMRQLNTEAYMHNRARLITASFLIKDLLIDYRAGERYFIQNLACGETAVNNGNWQWVAGSSNDPQPYFRIFNPVTQSETYDPDGTYIRRHVPELQNVPNNYIHAPWTMPDDVQAKVGVRIGTDYPAPIVDHKMARDRANAAFKQARDAAGEQVEE